MINVYRMEICCEYFSTKIIFQHQNPGVTLYFGRVATTHYNNGTSLSRLFDMGAEYAGYTADITVSFPASGKFTESQKFVYNTCLKANKAVQKAMRPGKFSTFYLGRIWDRIGTVQDWGG
eukprot:sb/3476223/